MKQCGLIIFVFLLISQPAFTVDAVFRWNQKMYILQDNLCIRYDITRECVDNGYPQYIDNVFPGVWSGDIDAAVAWKTGKVYFFKDDQYLRFDLAEWRTDPGYPTRVTSSSWKGVWNDGVDGAVNWENGCIYFFKGDQYVRYNWVNDRVDNGYPMLITDNWKGLQSDVNAAVRWPGNKGYFFYDNNYYRYDDPSSSVDDGYPLLINEQTWPGLVFQIEDDVSSGSYRAYLADGAQPAIDTENKFPLSRQFRNGCFAFGIKNIAEYKYGKKIDCAESEKKVGKKRSELWSAQQIEDFLGLNGLECRWYNDVKTFFHYLTRGEPVLIQYKKWYRSDAWVGHFVAVYSFDQGGVWISESVTNQRLCLPWYYVFDTTGTHTQFSFAVVNK